MALAVRLGTTGSSGRRTGSRSPSASSAPASLCEGAGKGPRFAVWGVDPSDVLNVRAEPNAKSEVLGELPPNATGVSLAGDKDVGSWRKIECGKISGWVNGRFLSREKAGQ